MEPKLKVTVVSHDTAMRAEQKAKLRARMEEFGFFDSVKKAVGLGGKGGGGGNPYHSSKDGKFTTGPGGGKGGTLNSGTAEEGEGGLSGLLKPAQEAVKKHQDAAEAANAAAGAAARVAGKAKFEADTAAWVGRRDAVAAGNNAAYGAWAGRKAAFDATAGAGVEQAIAAKFVPMQAAYNAAQAKVTSTSAAADAKLTAYTAAVDRLSRTPTDMAHDAQWNAALTAANNAESAYSAASLAAANAQLALVNLPGPGEISAQIDAYRAAHPVPQFGEAQPVPAAFTDPQPVCDPVAYPGCDQSNPVIPPAGLAPGQENAAQLVGGIEVSASTKALIDGALATIAQVHSVTDVGRKVSITESAFLGDGVHGTYSPALAAIQVLPNDTEDGKLAFTHEFGHYLQNEQLTSPEQVAAINNFETAALDTPTIKALQKKAANPLDANFAFAKYALNPQEVWARAYSQYVTLRSHDPEDTKELILGRAGFGQWSDDEFTVLANQLDKVFSVKGLKR